MTSKVTCCFVLLACCALAAAAAEPLRLRPAGFDTSGLPKVVAPLDVKRTPNGWPTLTADMFHLLEDGARTTAPDKIEKFRDAGMGLALIVALDASGSMNGRPMRAIQDGLAQLVNRKRSQDRVSVLSFADDTRWETHWDSSEQATKDAFRNLKTRGNLTRLYDAIEDAKQEFDRQAQDDNGFPMRRCILVLSDGHDEGSHETLGELLGDIAKSRVRIDAVGLAHSPLWLGNLRQIARAGFGEFQTAVQPEDLTALLGRGIDSLLDMPTLEFHAEHLETDGKTHQIGIEYGSGSRDQLPVKLPEPFWRTRRALYAIAGVLVLVICIVAFWRSRSSKPVVSAAPVIPVVEALPVASVPPPRQAVRAATVAEPVSRVMRSAQTAAPVISYETFAPAANVAVKPVRLPTVLAANPAARAVHLSLKAVSGPYAGQSFMVSKDEFWIGSAPNNNLCLGADAGVSGNHACIRREQPFHRVYDNESLNNTFVNGQAIGREITLLQPGDRIRIGASEFAVGAND